MPEGAARLHQINVSPQGGVPKRPVLRTRATPTGLEGDGVAHPRIHGGPERAVCLYALERILALQKEGHPVFPGSLGENLTTVGLDFDAVEPGDRLGVGPEVVLEVASYTTPCRTIAGSFREGEYGRIGHVGHPGWSRVYARVLVPGALEAGMPIRRERQARIA